MKRVFLLPYAAMTVILLASFSYQGLSPIVRAGSSRLDWRLTVDGLVEHPLNLTLAEIEAMPQTTVNAAIICVDFPHQVVTQGNWTGVRLWFLLEAARISPNATKVAFFANDGYSTDLTVETAQREDIVLAYEKDGVPLSEALRLVVPGKWGYKWISQVTGIKLVDYDFKGYWESRGYSDTADVSEDSTGGPTPTGPGPVIPEFPSVLPLLVPMILVVLFAVALKNRAKKPQTQWA